MDAVIKGEAQLMDEAGSALLGAVRAGQLVPLFTTADTRDPLFPGVPTTSEVGLPDLTIQGFFGLLAPPETPAPVVERLNKAMRDALAAPLGAEGLREPRLHSRLQLSGADGAAHHARPREVHADRQGPADPVE